jgi:hypothetical protein
MRKYIALQSSQILYTFVLRAEIPTTFLPHLGQKWSHANDAIQKYTKFARLYFPHFTKFRNQTLQIY